MKQLLLVRRVAGESMQPSFKPGRIVLGWGFGKPKIGDIVILSHEGLEKIKRISHIEGDKIYVQGDNPAESTDSRQFGWLPLQTVIAKVIWPRLRQAPASDA